MSGPSMLALVGDMSGPTLWRVLQPFTALEKSGYPCAWDFKDADGIGTLAPSFDGVVIPRLSWTPFTRRAATIWFDALRRAGKITVYDVDDDLFSEHLTRRTVEMSWNAGKSYDELEAERRERAWALAQCDGVTVSTQRLATIVRTLTERPVLVVPNAIDVPWFRRVLSRTSRQLPPITIGWAGGKRPDRDLSIVAEAWGRIATRYPSVTFVCAGYAPPVLVEAVPDSRLVVIPWLPLERYPEAIRELDIACCSVSDEPFNRAKSVIKAYEAAVCGAAVVATPALYGSLIVHGVNGYVAETVDDWTGALADLIERPSIRSMVARRLLRHVEKHCSLSENLWRWPSAWSTIAEDARVRRGSVVLA